MLFRRNSHKTTSVAMAIIVLAAGWIVSARQTPSPEASLSQLVLPPGFHINVYATNVQNARQMALGAKGTVFVGSRTTDKVYALVDRNGDHVADDVTITDTMVMAESVTSSKDGAIFFGSTTKGNIYRATPGAAQAEVWIQASTTGLTNVLGVLADDKASTLWVCANATGGRGTPPTGQTALRAFDLASGAAKGTWPFPGGGFCNDIAVGDDGTAYATDTTGRRILRLRPGGTALDVWSADQQLNGLDGVAILDGGVYVNCFFSGELFRASIQPDGTAGPLTKIETSMPFTRPDGLRTAGPNKMLQAEGQGRLTEITITGNRADVRVLKEGLTGATAVTQVGDVAFVLVERLRAVAVPYSAR